MSTILYLTTDCNMACEYCYEQRERSELSKKKEMTFDDAVLALNKSFKDESVSNSIVLFGGEPLLKFDLIKQILDYSYSELDNYFSFCLTTNGMLLDEEKIEYFKSIPNNLKLEISYDGFGNYRRVDRAGNQTTQHVKEVLQKCDDADLDYFISYTIHEGNHQLYITDIITLFETLPNLKGIKLNIYYKELDNIYGDYNKCLDKHKADLKRLYQWYNKPICNYTCDMCKKCVKSKNYNYFLSDSSLIQANKRIEKEFSQWNSH